MPSTMSVTCSRRAEESVNSPRINANSIATADTSVNAQTWWRKANSVDMARAPFWRIVSAGEADSRCDCLSAVIASEAKQSISQREEKEDCFVASILAMTSSSSNYTFARSQLI